MVRLSMSFSGVCCVRLGQAAEATKVIMVGSARFLLPLSPEPRMDILT